MKLGELRVRLRNLLTRIKTSDNLALITLALIIDAVSDLIGFITDLLY